MKKARIGVLNQFDDGFPVDMMKAIVNVMNNLPYHYHPNLFV